MITHTLCDSESCLLTEHKLTLSRVIAVLLKLGVKRTATVFVLIAVSVLFWMRGPVYDKKRILKRKS